MRIYELSKKINKPSKEIIAILAEGGFSVGSHMSALSDKEIQYIEKAFGLMQKQEVPKEGVLPQPSTKKDLSKNSNSVAAAKTVALEKIEKNTASVDERAGCEDGGGDCIVAKPMLLGDLSEQIKIPSSQLIIFLLKEGVLCNKNQLLSIEQVRMVAEHFEFEVVGSKVGDGAQAEAAEEGAQNKGDSARLPVAVVVGHVDHGKTTLLDHLRKTRVAAREKGGITQHLGAYQVDTPHGNMVFLDTPGHEAFTAIRERGVKVADITVLIVAADDGVMPQTIEAIRQAKLAKLPIVVAVTKMDKASGAQVEKVKTKLSQHGLLSEEWGGDTVIVPISAVDGTGIDDLLEMLLLQTEMLDLKTDLDVPARGYALEAKQEKGRGGVATFIAQHGVLKVGDFFVCGKTTGKVVSLKDCSGKTINKVGPSVPVSLAGFDSLPEAGDFLEVVPEREYRRVKAGGDLQINDIGLRNHRINSSGDAVKILLRADTSSSKEAAVGAIKKQAKSMGEDVLIVDAGVGNVSEGDIIMASSTGAIVYGFGVKSEPGASALAKASKTDVRMFSIIYKLVEDVEEVIRLNKKVEIIQEKIGVAIVRKIFKIKKVGVIAGVYVSEGKIVRNAQAIVMRDGEEVGRGSINSLQRDRKAMKELVSGYEGAFILSGFEDWEEGDSVECIVEKKSDAS